MKKRMLSRALFCLTAVLLAACGSETLPVEGLPCSSADDCGQKGLAMCVGGECTVFDESSGFGSATVNLSFYRERAGTSGHIYFILGKTADGHQLGCEEITSGEIDLQVETVNHLRTEPKYLLFHWTGGTFFPDNLIQFIRPATGAMAIAEAYSQPNCEGVLTAIGCTDEIHGQPIDIVAGVLLEDKITINLQEP
ncbi:MAG: hypothetical protein JXR96_29180 [Deltaproteobacteria bacterium]|nr:hypothetical protein [Deltaproteobacteria bacterium]